MKNQSENLVWVVQILFGLVFAQSLLLYKEILLRPLTPDNVIPFVALATVYVTTLISWKDFSITMSKSPYGGKTIIGDFRFYTDVIIVVIYSITMFSIDSLTKDGNKELYVFLLCYIIIYALYLLSGIIRVIEYGLLASRYILISLYLILFVACYFAYSYLKNTNIILINTLNFLTIISLLTLVISYRISRWIIIFRQKKVKNRGLIIAIDIDGVLANQIDYLLPIILRDYSINFEYKDIVKWDMPFADTNIKDFIEKYQNHDTEYISTMKLIEGSKYYTDKLYKKNKIMIITARDPSLDELTKAWLKEKKINYDIYINKKAKNKSDYHFDALIDDFPGNFNEITAQDRRLSILFEQPWNINDQISKEKPFIRRASGWNDAFKITCKFKSAT